MPNQLTASNNGQHSTFPDDELGPLPEGWEERVHTDGRIFYIDHSKYIFLTFSSNIHIIGYRAE